MLGEQLVRRQSLLRQSAKRREALVMGHFSLRIYKDFN